MIILGAGPASLTAQIYALRYDLKVLSIGGVVGGLMTEPSKICNWPGEMAISGHELTEKMVNHVKVMNGEILVDQIEALKSSEGGWQLTTKQGKEFLARAVLLAMGTEHRKLGLESEARLVGRGVAYCATCDAMFFKGRNVAVVGGGNSAMTAALYLADLCPKVYLVYRSELKGEAVWRDEVLKHQNIIKVADNQISDLLGENKLEKIILEKEFEGSKELLVDGLFVEIGTKPKSELFKALGGEVDDKDHVVVKKDQSTNLTGIWAAGDMTNGSNNLRQILTACAEGAIATESIYKFLRSNN